jgi:hypothetical protein
LLKILFFEIGALFLTFLILVSSDSILARLQKRHVNFMNILFFIILVKILIAPFQLIFFGLFISYENYNFFFLANCICVLLYIYIFVFSARVFHSKKRFILLGAILNIIFLNILVYIIYKCSLDSYSTFDSPYYTDQILNERVEKGKCIYSPYNVPTHRVIYKERKRVLGTHLLLSTPIDTLSKGSFETSEEYVHGIKRNIIVLDTLIPHLSFTRNKEFFTLSLELYKSIDSILNLKVINYTDDDIQKQTIYMNSDSSESYTETIVKFPPHISELNYRLFINEYETEQISDHSTLPLDLLEYFTPIIFLID